RSNSQSLTCFYLLSDVPTSETHSLSLHDALPICLRALHDSRWAPCERRLDPLARDGRARVSALPRPERGRRVLQRHAEVVAVTRSEEHTSELQSRENLVCRLLLEKKNHNRSESAT